MMSGSCVLRDTEAAELVVIVCQDQAASAKCVLNNKPGRDWMVR